MSRTPTGIEPMEQEKRGEISCKTFCCKYFSVLILSVQHTAHIVPLNDYQFAAKLSGQMKEVLFISGDQSNLQ